MFLYVIKLESEKYLLHCSTRNKNDTFNILLECELQYDYVKKYKPLSIIESTDFSHKSEIDFYVKKFMHFYGIDNVRGGSYIEAEMSNNTKQHILKEFEITLEKYEMQNMEIQNILLEYSEIEKWTLDELQKEQLKIETIKTKYNHEKSMLHKLKYGNTNGNTNGNIEINRTFLTDLQWLCIQISKIMKNMEVDNKCKKTYVAIVNKMKLIYKIFINYTDTDDTYNPKIHLYEPSVILDIIFYHNKDVKDWSSEFIKIEIFINYYEYIYYCVINRIDEYEFDVKTYPPNIENICKYRENYLQKYSDKFTHDHDGKDLHILGQS
tara:strand:+ start:34 stop:1002 length:969 start_codon:yes stop_codon:yes gene_type:complete